jgi:DNA-binding CsgD family transcriptional regulator
LQKSAKLADSLGQTHIKSVATLRLSQIAEAQGDFSAAFSLFKQSAALKDSVLNKQKIEHIHSMEVAYETKEKAMEINTLKLTQAAERSERNLTYVLSVLGLSFLGFFLLQARQKLKYAKQTLSQNQQELKNFASLLNAKNAQLLKLENALHDGNGSHDKPLNAEQVNSQDPDFIEDDGDSLFFNSRILTFEDWEAFKHRFEQANPGYLLRVRKTYAALTSAEERLFLLIKLRFSTQEIADTLGISINGVKKGRQRLRKRLALQSEDDLDLFILSF